MGADAPVGRRVLVVDDEPDMRFVIGTHLRRLGWEVEEASSGEDALNRCRTAPVDIVVLDHRMPGLTGLETAQRLLSDHGEAGCRPVALFSAYLNPEVEEQARALGLRTFSKADIAGLVEYLSSL